MGDRTTVTLTVLKAQAEAAEKLFGEYGDADEECEQDDKKSFIFNEVNLGDLEFLPLLATAGIAYDSYWGLGNEYIAGTESLRFTSKGVIEANSIYEGESAAPLDELAALLNEPSLLKQYIVNRQKRFSVLPWNNQLEYGKLYLARQLIDPS